MSGERDKASENPYESPRTRETTTSVGCLAVALALLGVASLALAVCIFRWMKMDGEMELVGISLSPTATRTLLGSIAFLAMLVIAALAIYLRHFDRRRSP
jgi:uncharacterized membrane protein YidH (DUF202 family)